MKTYELDPQYAKDAPHPHIRSFVSHRVTLTSAQEDALNRLYPLWVVEYGHTHLDYSALFKRQAPTILEIGFGMGETTAKIAQTRPQDNFLALEVYKTGVASLLKKIEDENLNNIRIIQHDAVEVLRDMIPVESLDGVHIYFPDPWPKKRHHKRRLIQAPFVRLLCSRLKPGAYIHCATDWEEYAAQMLEVLSQEPLLKNTAESFAPKPDYRPLTKFENRGLKLGYRVNDLVFKRV
ncbi:tRNA (guanosine(46)-N7)-methyltransferase TrmB [Basilea psittacipulmonis]|uniref:tRNA (guanosine(46)-N7)-methyltransferase TrmB n=1 Tax=Basilea psittacipulmonis TaxID=1472345 RepID=UPI000ADBACB2|nr:tRNA (guanosine(46)-N7)-methyltransferase TrmB [Basilea psittacipulmonis]